SVLFLKSQGRVPRTSEMNHNHAYMILAFIEKHAAYISALNGALRRNWVRPAITQVFAGLVIHVCGLGNQPP
ncbi:MAG: hypothetical protein ACLVIG_04690, partial [Sutterella wadsworthensis]